MGDFCGLWVMGVLVGEWGIFVGHEGLLRVMRDVGG